MGWFKRLSSGRKGTRRKYNRVIHHLRVNYQIGNELLRLDCRTTDITEGGIHLNLYQKLATGTPLKLYLYFQGATEPVLLLGKVIWIRGIVGREYPYDAGIEFDFIDPSARAKIQNYIQGISQK